MSFNPEERNNLSRLLISDDISNMEIGTALLGSNTDEVPFFEGELALLAFLHDNKQLNQQASELLEKHYSKHKIGRWRNTLKDVVVLKNKYQNSASYKRRLDKLYKLKKNWTTLIAENESYCFKFYKLARHLHLNIKDYYDMAVEYYRIYLDKNPFHEDASYCLAYYLADFEETCEEAKELYKRVLEINPKSEGAYNNIGHIYDRQYNNYSKALPYYEKALALKPAETRYMRNTSYVLIKLGGEDNQKRAKELLQKAVDTVPENSSNWKHFGDYFWIVERDFPEAKRCYLQGLKREPENALLLSNLAEVYIIHYKMYDVAYTLYKKSIDLEKSWYSFSIMITLLVEHLADFEEATRYYHMFLEVTNHEIRQAKHLSKSKWESYKHAERKLLEYLDRNG